jgi:hypothetical protein
MPPADGASRGTYRCRIDSMIRAFVWGLPTEARRAPARRLAGSTGLEPAASGVTGRRSNQLNYDPNIDWAVQDSNL